MKSRIFLPLILLLCFACSKSDAPRLTIAAAANVGPALKKIGDAFSEEHDVPVAIVIGSSGKLASQIQQGAPYDLFLSADMFYPETLYKDSLTVGEPTLYAQGTLVLWSLKKEVSLDSFGKLGKIAYPNPKLAPYGRAAKEVLQKTPVDSYILTENVSQCDQYIISKVVDAGFTAKSSVIKYNKGFWVVIPDSLYTPIDQGMVVLKGKNQHHALLFHNFLLSGKAKAILASFGYQ